uniref:Enoyl-[acyl-carrier-protein] reductase, mitochondrial n=1 Tax=Glossina morsitans morsitans TaxID=37546 RepID=A0A1B0FDC3_GLOMM
MWSLLNSKTFKALSTTPRLWRRTVTTQSLIYRKFGQPSNELQIIEEDVPNPIGKQVLIKILRAPVNRMDLDIIQGSVFIVPYLGHNFFEISLLGTHPFKPKILPAIGGGEFVGEVVKVGELVVDLNEGDLVIPLRMHLGSWTKYKLAEKEEVYKIPEYSDLKEAATIGANTCAAYRLLKGFVNLRPGDSIIQNGANGFVGQTIHKLCKLWGIKSLGVIRDRPDAGVLKLAMERLGATVVLTDKEIDTTDVYKANCLQKPKLALNCTGGEMAESIARHLDKCGIMVTYAGVSGKPFKISALSSLILNEQRFTGFWITKWVEENLGSPHHVRMMNELIRLLQANKLKTPPLEIIPFDDFKEAFATCDSTSKRFMLDMTADEDVKWIGEGLCPLVPLGPCSNFGGKKEVKKSGKK